MTSTYNIHGDIVSPVMTESIDSYNGNLSSTSLTGIHSCDECINPRCYEELPDDLLIQIFIRVPVKSLLLGMCVCKRWNFIIKDPGFVRKHLKFQKMMSKNCGHFLLEHEDQVAKVYSLFLFDNIAMSSTLSSFPYHSLVNFSLVEEYDHLVIDGPINGLYCLHNQYTYFVIWNPSINEAVFLPLPEDEVSRYMNGKEERWLEKGVIGFGTDPLDEEDYKVILVSQWVTFESSDFTYAMLYTSKTNSWRVITDGVRSLHRSLNNTYLNGLYYWVGQRTYTAVVFDMSKNKEAFRKMTTPCRDADLALHNDHITLFSVNKDLNVVEIWVMLEESNWLKTMSVAIQGSVVKSLGFWKTENQMLLVMDDFEDTSGQNNKQTVLYNTATQKAINIGPEGSSLAFRTSVYYESLVSITGGITKFRGNTFASLLDYIWRFFLERTISDEETTSSD